MKLIQLASGLKLKSKIFTNWVKKYSYTLLNILEIFCTTRPKTKQNKQTKRANYQLGRLRATYPSNMASISNIKQKLLT